MSGAGGSCGGNATGVGRGYGRSGPLDGGTDDGGGTVGVGWAGEPLVALVARVELVGAFAGFLYCLPLLFLWVG